MTKTIILSSGGTGGHVFPAISLAGELSARGYHVAMMTDQRGYAFQKATSISKIIQLPIWRGPTWARFGSIILGLSLCVSFLWAFVYMLFRRPKAVIGFGGYPSVPALLAAKILGCPTAFLEQNAVLGRANRLMGKWVDRIAVCYDNVKYSEEFQEKIIQTGNPVRPSINALRSLLYQPPQFDGPFRLLIIGGSQGARIFSTIIPATLSKLPITLRHRLKIYQQCRPEFLDLTQQAYQHSEIEVVLQPFFEDMEYQLAQAHLVIARAGASTVAELTISGRPALLVPYAAAMDNHQEANAISLGKKGAAWVVLESDFTPAKLQDLIQQALINEDLLKIMAKNMHVLGQPDAAVKLAQMVEDLLP
ncbi:MAG: undecaprenyldiphospho-muramoylpentapeptide beta-N-acetylglucosaminyltransferase [Alphaproteobacteria bacterium]|nr:undecaprenyldiphospho-muramoylpentapeptide beta-N-acetylglucosaminyltransferase [Alphaproteobacteria bacterium]